jgi:hypothetical protein
MMRKIILILALILPLNACVGIGRKIDNGMQAAPCVAFHPIYIHPGDKLTTRTANELWTHNETGTKLCQWARKRSPSLNAN